MTPRSPEAFESNVFINCPFDPKYLPLLRPLLFTVVALGFTPRIATERSNSAESRMDKICGLIRESRLSIHDLSRLKPGTKEFARMNMPFELGVDYGSMKYGDTELQTKLCLILGAAQYDYQKALSDLSGVDIKSHGEEPEAIVRAARDWFLETVGVRPVPPSAKQLWYDFNEFMSALYDARQHENFNDEDLKLMPTAEYIEVIREWVTTANAAPERTQRPARAAVRAQRPVKQ